MGTENSGIETIFSAALQCQSAAERAAYLSEACAGNAEMRGRVEALLRAHDQAGPFLEAPDTVTLAQKRPAHEKPGTLIGHYKLLEQIGEGGFGVVYMAEQEHPIRRKVALKIIKPGMDTRQVIARFEAERQALALMDHPNIAKVFDAGETASGRPYFVMELVRGIPITAYCDQGKLGLRERLELFQHVCQAIQHAHHKGIMHRDIKPSNILVTLHDGVPVVKVIDFGIAKAMGHELTDKTMFTGFAQVMGTPLYASPEQVALGGLDIDTRTDVYSLGVLLYELLTGTTPFEKERLQKAAYEEMRRIVREEEPPRPSVRMTAVSPQTTDIAAQRASQPRRLAQMFRGELDWIVMKALEKDRSRRYDTPLAFAGDIARYLANDPVEARPPSTVYRVNKFVRRHRWGSAVAAAAVILLASSTILIWNEQRHTAMERDRAEAARTGLVVALAETDKQRQIAVSAQVAAQRLAERATAASEFLMSVLSSPDRNKGLANNVRVADLLDDAAEGLAEKLQGQPQLEIDARYILGSSYHSLGLADKARDQWRAAYRLVPTLPPGDAERALVKIGPVLALAETPEDGLRFLKEAQEAATRVYPPTSPETHAVEAQLGRFLTLHGKLADGKAILQRLHDWADDHPGEVTTGERITWLDVRAQASLREGDHAMALALRQESKRLAVLEEKPPKVFDTIATVLYTAERLIDREKYTEACDILEKTLPDYQTRLGAADGDARNVIGLYESDLLGMGKYQKYLEFTQQRYDLLQSMQKSKQITITKRGQAQLDFALANAYWLAGQDDEAHSRKVLALATMSSSPGGGFDDAGLPSSGRGRISVGNPVVSGFSDAALGTLATRGNFDKTVYWRSTMLQEGLGRDDAWKTPALRAQLWCLLESAAFPSSTMPADLALDTQWNTLKFHLRQWTADQPHLKLKAEGGLKELRALDLPAGEYLLELQFERSKQPLTKLTSWITIVPFHAALHRFTGVYQDGTPRDWYERKTMAPLAQRDFPGVALSNVLIANAGPGGRTTYFAMVGTASVRLPPGKYRIVVDVRGGLRLDLDGRRVLDSWTPDSKEEESQEVELDAGNHALRFEYFHSTGPFLLWLRFEPTDTEDDLAVEPALRRKGFSEKIASQTAAIQMNPGNVAALRSRADIYARYGQFELAADDFESARQVQASNFSTLKFGAYAHLQAGHLKEYADRCQELFANFGATSGLVTREQFAKVCAVGPSTIDGHRLEALMDFDSDAQTPDVAVWSRLARGLVNFHNGDWKKSADEMFKSLMYDDHRYQHAAALFYLAMAHEHLGDHDQALALLKNATDFADAEVAPEAGLGDLVGSQSLWVDWIVVHRARQEAEALFGLRPATGAATQPATAPRP